MVEPQACPYCKHELTEEQTREIVDKFTAYNRGIWNCFRNKYRRELNKLERPMWIIAVLMVILFYISILTFSFSSRLSLVMMISDFYFLSPFFILWIELIKRETFCLINTKQN